MNPRVALILATCAAALGGGAQADGRAPASPFAGAAAQAAASRRPASRPAGFVRACGTIHIGARPLRVDVGEGDGGLVTCRQARRVGRTYLRDHRRHFHVATRTWTCYKSRPDGQGWAYNCLTTTDGYVDVGIGRRW